MWSLETLRVLNEKREEYLKDYPETEQSTGAKENIRRWKACGSPTDATPECDCEQRRLEQEDWASDNYERYS